MPLHNELQQQYIHSPYRWVVADENERLNITTNPDGSDITDTNGLYCICLQTDTNSVYILTNTSPITWSSVSGGESTKLIKTAGEDIGSYTVVKLDDDNLVRKSDILVDTDAAKVLGVTTQAVTNGSDVIITTQGVITNSTWTFSNNPIIYVGSNGTLTTTPNTSGWVLRIGRALDTTSILVNFKAYIKLI